MDEGEWLSSTDPQAMLTFLRHSSRASDRKLRLFASACCRCMWDLLTEQPSRKAVAAGEAYADGLIDEEALRLAHEEVIRVCGEWNAKLGITGGTPRRVSVFEYQPSRTAGIVSSLVAYPVLYTEEEIEEGWVPWGTIARNTAGVLAEDTWARTKGRERARLAGETRLANESRNQCAMLQDIVGDPFHPPPPLAPSVLEWQGGTVVHLAHAAYEERELPSGHLNGHLLGVLGDALEEAGGDAELVAHLRGPGPHVRGCHAVDLILGRS